MLMFSVELFIDAVKERPALYNPSHKLYHRKENRARLWEEIGQVMFPDWPNLNPRERLGKGLLMQKKWKSLKDCFNRELRLQKLHCCNPKRKQYEFYKRLLFLLNRKYPLQETVDMEEVTVKTETPEDVQQLAELSCGQSLLQEPPHSHQNQSPLQEPPHSQQHQLLLQEPPHSQQHKLLLQEPPHNQQPPQKKIILDIENVRDSRKSQNKKSGAEDSDRLFLMSFVKDLNKLPLSTKYWVKMKFSEIMHQATMNLAELEKAKDKDGFCEDHNGDID